MALVQAQLEIMGAVAVAGEQVEELKCFMKMHRSIRLLFLLHVIPWMAVWAAPVVLVLVIVTDLAGETDQSVLFTKIKPRMSLRSCVIQRVLTSPVFMTPEIPRRAMALCPGTLLRMSIPLLC